MTLLCLNENGLTIINDGTTAGITIKDAAGNKQFYADADGNLILSGGINSTFGKVGGWTINNHKIYAGGTDGLKTAAVQVPADGSYYVFAAGGESHDNYGDCPFRVGKDGKLFATDAEIKGKVTATSGSFTGSVYASDGSFNGKVTASEGKIGGWVISNNKIYGGGTDGLKTAAVQVPTDHSSTVFAAGGENHDDYSDCPFRVDKYGNLYATSAEIKGKVTATSGSFKGSVYATSGTFKGTVYANSGNIGNWNIKDGWIIGDDSSSGKTTFLSAYGISRQYSDGSGGSHVSWERIFSHIGVDTSDSRLKNSIEALPKSYDTFFDLLQPKRYKYNDGTSDRYHTGFIAQDVVDALGKSGLSTQDFAAICLDKPTDKNECWYLRRDEFVALNTFEIQRLKKQVEKILEILKISNS